MCMKGLSRVFIGFSCLLLSFTMVPAAKGQLGLYGGFSAANTNIPNSKWLYGTTFGGYYNAYHVPLVNVGLDARVSILDGSNTVNGLVGPRVEVHIPFLKPYLEGLIGASNISGGQGVTAFSQTAFSYGFTAGADLTILPRIDWRVVDYSYVRTPSVVTGTNQDILTTGIVLRLPVPHL
jgi:hypothetical protein